jgi:cytochrome d ubiquinol oxidase subunit I
VISTVAMELSRLQFALTAMYHFLFVPLTIGLSVLLAVMESVYVMTGRKVWRDMTKYWGLLFGINFAMGVATGITMEFQFGTNWAYYAHYVGDIFGAPLAIEGAMAFFLEATFVGLFFFGWDRLSKVGHLVVTWLVALATNLSALWILIANGWMQYPVGAKFNPATMRMELTSFADLVFNPVAQAKFVHTVSAGYVTGSIFVMAISAWFLLKGRNPGFAKRSMTVAASFGLASALSVVVLGDESGYLAGENQKMKIAAIEAMWDTEPAPAAITVVGIPDMAAHTTHYAIKIPWVLGLIATRSIDTVIPGINQLVADYANRIKSGMIAYGALAKIRTDPADSAARAEFDAHVGDLGYALLLKRFTENVTDATPAQIQQAAWRPCPMWRPSSGPSGSWSASAAVHRLFRLRLLALDGAPPRPLSLVPAIVSAPSPAPWITHGARLVRRRERPPALDDRRRAADLPLRLQHHPGQVGFSLAGFVIFYTSLAVVELYLMVKYIRLGPDGVHGGAHGAGETARLTPGPSRYPGRRPAE